LANDEIDKAAGDLLNAFHAARRPKIIYL
jgi:hypothetical protein